MSRLPKKPRKFKPGDYVKFYCHQEDVKRYLYAKILDFSHEPLVTPVAYIDYVKETDTRRYVVKNAALSVAFLKPISKAELLKIRLEGLI